MPDKNTKDTKHKTLTEYFVNCENIKPEIVADIELLRIDYEAFFGETDMSRRYTSQLSISEQNWLLEHYPRRFWDGLPPFFQEYLSNALGSALHDGRLDNVQEAWIQAVINRDIPINPPPLSEPS